MGKVSILIPVYKGAGTLPKCVISCLDQTYKNIEVVIVIDGSPDNSYDIAVEFNRIDPRVVVFNKQNEGLPKTRRVAFEHSTGELIYHLDQDDFIESDTIEVLINKLTETSADIVVSGSIYETLDGKYITQWNSTIVGNTKSDYLNAIFKLKLQSSIWGKLIKRDIYKVIDVIEKHTGGEDYLANIMMICYNKTIKIVTEPALLHHYVVHNKSLTNTMPAEEFFDFTNKIEEILTATFLEDKVFESWSYFRVIRGWRYYLRQGGKKYLTDKKFIKNFYNKYYSSVKKRLTYLERFELTFYKYNQPIAWNFSRVYLRLLKICKQFSN